MVEIAAPSVITWLVLCGAAVPWNPAVIKRSAVTATPTLPTSRFIYDPSLTAW